MTQQMIYQRKIWKSQQLKTIHNICSTQIRVKRLKNEVLLFIKKTVFIIEKNYKNYLKDKDQ